MKVPSIVLLVLAGLLHGGWAREQMPSASSDHGREEDAQCAMEHEKLVAVQWNAKLGEYTLVPDGRQLRGGTAKNQNSIVHHDHEPISKHDELSWFRAIPWESESSRRRQLPRVSGDERDTVHHVTFLVRPCQCGDQVFYCPLEFDSCAFTNDNHDPNVTTATVQCFRASDRREEDLAPTCLLVSLVWFGLLFCCLACTECGRVVIHFLLAKCRTGHNEQLADYLLQYRRHRAFLLMQRSVYHHRWTMGTFDRGPSPGTIAQVDDDDEQATCLVLKTLIFAGDDVTSNAHRHHHDSGDRVDDSGDDAQCIICLQQLNPGDRIGDLPCGHNTFHVDCLKTWVQRRNACPLCNATDIATTCDDRKPNRPRAATQSTASE